MLAWMTLLHSAVSDTSVPHYIRLFLTKAVLHVDKRHVARTEADPALQARSPMPQHGPRLTLNFVCVVLVTTASHCFSCWFQHGSRAKNTRYIVRRPWA